MTKIALTGAGGFLGFHLRAAARTFGMQTVGIPLGEGFDVDQATAALDGAAAIIHLAGVNRGTDQEVTEGNHLFAEQLATSLQGAHQPPARLVYANSIQATNGSLYGTAKSRAAEALATQARRLGIAFEDVRLPNLFGEYGRPFYNSVVATFSHLTACGQQPKVLEDKELQLLHAQTAAEILLDITPVAELYNLSQCETVTGVKNLLEEFHELYAAGEFPDLSTTFRRDLFNTYRSYTFPDHAPLNIQQHADQRGTFFEVVRSHGGTGQTSFSSTAPGVTRGEHFHRRKVERFTVVAGEAEIQLRRLFDHRIFRYRISGDEPKSVDMPTLYTHNITNVGDETLYTAFWTNDIFDPNNPDTIAETVACENA